VAKVGRRFAIERPTVLRCVRPVTPYCVGRFAKTKSLAPNPLIAEGLLVNYRSDAEDSASSTPTRAR
jgi:hypothetical protein